MQILNINEVNKKGQLKTIFQIHNIFPNKYFKNLLSDHIGWSYLTYIPNLNNIREIAADWICSMP